MAKAKKKPPAKVPPVARKPRKLSKHEQEVAQLCSNLYEARLRASTLQGEVAKLRSLPTDNANLRYDISVAEKRNRELSEAYTSVVSRLQLAEATIGRVRSAVLWDSPKP